jgi:hypothetical protein
MNLKNRILLLFLRVLCAFVVNIGYFAAKSPKKYLCNTAAIAAIAAISSNSLFSCGDALVFAVNE